MKQPIFYFKRFEPVDYILIIIYILVSAIVFLNYKSVTEFGYQRDYILIYSIATHLIIYFFNYRSLRNFGVYLIWFCIGLFHFYLYVQLNFSHNAIGLRNTIIMLLLFQILRIASLNIQKQEFLAVSKSKYDLFNERRINFLDFIIFIIYFGSTLFLLILD